MANDSSRLPYRRRRCRRRQRLRRDSRARQEGDDHAGRATKPRLPYHRPLLLKSFLGKGTPLAAEKLLVHDAAWFEKKHIDLRLDTHRHAVQHRAASRRARQRAGRRISQSLPGHGQPRAPSAGRRRQISATSFTCASLRDVQALREIADTRARDRRSSAAVSSPRRRRRWLRQLPEGARHACMHRGAAPLGALPRSRDRPSGSPRYSPSTA